MHLFNYGPIRLRSGTCTDYKVDCDALTDNDWADLAHLLSLRIRFAAVEGVPRGGLLWAAMLDQYCVTIQEAEYPLLIVDDVYTTGAALEATRRGRDAVGVVLFARNALPQPSWIQALWIKGPLL